MLDIHMLEMDGFETIAAIKEQKITSDIPVIFLMAGESPIGKTIWSVLMGLYFIEKTVGFPME